jgi:tetratricopeptide (TPR) repeat protein
VSSSSAGDLIAAADRYFRAQLLVHDVPRRSTRVLRPEHPGAKWLDLSADGRYLSTGPWDGSHVQVWDARTGKLVWELPAVHARVRFSPDGRMLAVDEGGRYGVWNTANWQPLLPKRERSLEAFPAPLAWSPDGRMLATLNSRRQVCLLETSSFTELATLALDEQQVIEALTFSPDQSRLLAGTHHPGIVHVWDLGAIRTELRSIGLDWQPAYESDPALSRSTKPIRLRHELDDLAPQSSATRADLLKQFRELSRLIAAEPNDGRHHWHRARTCLSLHRYEEALVDATRATELTPDSHHGWFWKGRALQMLSRCAEAIGAFEKSLELHPKDAWCCRHLASLYTEGPPEVREARRGLALAKQAIDLVGGISSSSEAVPVYLNTLAMAHSRQGNWTAALDALDRAVAMSNARPSSTTLLRQALCYQQLGHPAQARRCYDEALDQIVRDRYDAQFNFDTLRQEAASAIGVE